MISANADMREVLARLAERHEIASWDARVLKAFLTILRSKKSSINQPYDKAFVAQYGCKS